MRSWILTSLGTELPFHIDSSTFAFTLSCTYQHLCGRTLVIQVQVFPFSKCCDFSLHFAHDHCHFANVSSLKLLDFPWNFSVLLLTCLLVQGRQRSLRLPSKLLDDWPQTSKEVHHANLCGNEGMVHGANECQREKYLIQWYPGFFFWSKETSKKAANFTVKSFCKNMLFVPVGIGSPASKINPLGFHTSIFHQVFALLVLPVCKFELSFFVIKMRTFNPLRAGEGRGASNPISDLQNAQGVKWGQTTSACSTNLGIFYVSKSCIHMEFFQDRTSTGAVEDVGADSSSKEHFTGTDNPVLSWHLDYLCIGCSSELCKLSES